MHTRHSKAVRILRQESRSTLALHFLPFHFGEPRQKIGTHYMRTEKAAQVVSMMLEGMSIRAISRLTGVDRNTILSLLETAGDHCTKLWNAKLRNMRSDFIQADEIWTFCGCHQRRLQPGAPAEWGDYYVRIALDSTTKMIISYYVGKRDGESAHEFMRDFSQRIEGRFQLTTDGLRWYIPAIDSNNNSASTRRGDDQNGYFPVM